MATWAIDALLIPLFYSHQYSFGVLLEDLTFRNVSFFSVGWINPIFIITMILMLVDRTPRLSAIFRCIVLLLVGLCWVALIYRDVYPREGYFLWTAGIFLVLFSRGLPRWPVRCTQCLINAVTGQVNLLPAFAAESRRRGHLSRNIADRPISASSGPKFQGNGDLSGVGRSDRFQRLHVAGNFGGDFVFGDFEVVAGLEIHPECGGE